MPASTSSPTAEEQARPDAYYGGFTSGKEKEALSVPLRLVAAKERR